MGRDELIENIRARVARARRLASYTNDPRTNEALLRMAEEGEADLRQLEIEQAEQTKMQLPPQA